LANVDIVEFYFHYDSIFVRQETNMKEMIRGLVHAAALKAYENDVLSSKDLPAIEIETPKVRSHGDFATNLAMVSARIQKMAPRKIAEAIVASLDDSDGVIAKTEIAGPGFINFTLQPSAWQRKLADIHRAGSDYGRCNLGQGKKIQIEFVSSNPTGPLHVGHGRGAAVGDATGNILAFCGYDVQKEYYINDSGRQIRTLGRSVMLRYREAFGQEIDFPEDCYQGGYIRHLAAALKESRGDELLLLDETEAILICARYAATNIIADIREDLTDFGVTFDNWFSEQSLYEKGLVDQSIADLERRQLIYTEAGAKWFRSTRFGDEKDRVVVRQNGQTTYFASDIAYHQEKYSRGFERVIDVWGADHHGYIPRVMAAIEASGYRRDQFDVILVQLVNLLRGGEPVAMSTRAGEFVTLSDVVSEVGRDAARFLFLTRSSDSSLDFDLELAKQKTNDNPVYYVQYVHARICSILRKAGERGVSCETIDAASLSQLTEIEAIDLIKALEHYPETVAAAGRFMEPHRITYYLMSLASAFHTYYNKHRVLVDDPDVCRSRMGLITIVASVIRNGLTLLGVSAPKQM
jgi:arginyl-tRNA synthetase